MTLNSEEKNQIKISVVEQQNLLQLHSRPKTIFSSMSTNDHIFSVIKL